MEFYKKWWFWLLLITVLIAFQLLFRYVDGDTCDFLPKRGFRIGPVSATPSPRYECYYSKAIDSGDISYCFKIIENYAGYDNDATDCLSDPVINKGGISFCDSDELKEKIKELSKWKFDYNEVLHSALASCYDGVAGGVRDILKPIQPLLEDCEKIPDEFYFIRNKCYFNAGLALKDISICNNIPSSFKHAIYTKTNCERLIVVALRNLTT